MYDAQMGRFLSPDNHIQEPFDPQNYNRYAYAFNNPLMYTDWSGEFIFTAAIIVGAVVGAYIGGSMANGNYNPFKWDWGGGSTWTGVLGGAIIGAVSGGVGSSIAASMSTAGYSGLLSAGVGGAAGGAISGGGFSLLPGGDGKVLKGMGIGAASGFAGGVVGSWASKNVGNVAINGFNISGPAVRGLVGGTVGGVAGGYAGGFAGGLIETGDLSLAHKSGVGGLGMGAVIGGVSGFAGGYKYARDNNIDPITGKFENSKTIVIGRNQNGRVNPAAHDLDGETISESWRNSFGDNRIPDRTGLDFNYDWFSKKLDQGYNVINIGDGGISNYSPNFTMELNTLQHRSYPTIQARYYGFSSNRVRVIYYNNRFVTLPWNN